MTVLNLNYPRFVENLCFLSLLSRDRRLFLTKLAAGLQKRSQRAPVRVCPAHPWTSSSRQQPAHSERALENAPLPFQFKRVASVTCAAK